MSRYRRECSAFTAVCAAASVIQVDAIRPSTTCRPRSSSRLLRGTSRYSFIDRFTPGWKSACHEIEGPDPRSVLIAGGRRSANSLGIMNGVLRRGLSIDSVQARRFFQFTRNGIGRRCGRWWREIIKHLCTIMSLLAPQRFSEAHAISRASPARRHAISISRAVKV